MDKTFFQNLRKELEEKKKLAQDLKEAIAFGEETNNVDESAKAALIEANAQIKQFEAALKKRGF